MERCLICVGELPVSYNWVSFLMPNRRRFVCMECEAKFEKLQGELCECCGRALSSLSEEYKQGTICLDCIRWQQQGGLFGKNRSVYVYNDWMKEVMGRYKFRGDAVIAQAFGTAFRTLFQQHFASCCVVVPVPLSIERLWERGFNQAELLAKLLPTPILDCSLVREHAEKQSKKTREERLIASSPFSFAAAERFDNQCIVLVDDIYTTGTTVRQLAALFRERGARSVSSLTLCRG